MERGTRRTSDSSAALAEFHPEQYCKPGEITVHEVMDMKRAFDMIDEDSSGTIDVEELQGAATALGIPMDAENIQVLLGTKRLTFNMFFDRMTAKLTPEDNVDNIMHIFELFDTVKGFDAHHGSANDHCVIARKIQ